MLFDTLANLLSIAHLSSFPQSGFHSSPVSNALRRWRDARGGRNHLGASKSDDDMFRLSQDVMDLSNTILTVNARLDNMDTAIRAQHDMLLRLCSHLDGRSVGPTERRGWGTGDGVVVDRRFAHDDNSPALDPLPCE